MASYRNRFGTAPKLPPLPGGHWNFGTYQPTDRPIPLGDPGRFRLRFPAHGVQWAPMRDEAGIVWLIALKDAQGSLLYSLDAFGRGDNADGAARGRDAMWAVEDDLSARLGLTVDRRPGWGIIDPWTDNPIPWSATDPLSSNYTVLPVDWTGERSINRCLATFAAPTHVQTTEAGVLRVAALVHSELRIGYLRGANLPLYDPDDLGQFVLREFKDLSKAVFNAVTGNWGQVIASGIDAVMGGIAQSGKGAIAGARAGQAAGQLARLTLSSDGSEVGYIAPRTFVPAEIAGSILLALAAIL